eukprot:Nitzschia sp. Nitz4//scaffold16_size188269//49272//50926//NITZ4_001782-RA/size188269-augustus-gene-0.75-mRNA-1//1//CDS//3329538490//5932//frame0
MVDHHLRPHTENNYGSIPDDEGSDPPLTTREMQQRRSSAGSIASLVNSVGSSVRESVHRGLHYGGENVSIIQMEGDSTITNSSFNLIKNLVGAGVLALPSGVAAFASSPTAMLPATLWILIMGFLFAYEFQLIGKICSITLSSTFREVWEDTIGFRGALAVSVVNMLKPALGNLAYSMILADTFRSLLASVHVELTRTESLLLITFVAILPLCLMKNLDALAPFSVLGTGGILLTVACMAVRFFDGSYDVELDGKYIEDLPEKYRPLFGTYNGAWTGHVLVFAAMVFEAFVAHYNAPRFYNELHNANMPRFRFVVANAFGFSCVVYTLMTMFGFLTFGANCDGYILNNYSVHDELATICRIAIAFSVLFTYPIAFMGFRDGILDIIELPTEKQTSANLNIITLVLLAIVTFAAALVTDLGYVNAVGGGTLATAIVFVFPALMYQAAVESQSEEPTPEQQREVKMALVLMVVGVIMGLIGVIVEVRK